MLIISDILKTQWAQKIMISASDPRLKDKDRAAPRKGKKEDPHEIKTTEHVQQSSALFFQYNTQLGPPFRVLVDTNFINFSIKNKMDIVQSMMDTLYAKCIPYITDCVMAELEKLGSKYRIALRIVKDPRFETSLHAQGMDSWIYDGLELIKFILGYLC